MKPCAIRQWPFEISERVCVAIYRILQLHNWVDRPPEKRGRGTGSARGQGGTERGLKN